jgi:hypothetical protein
VRVDIGCGCYVHGLPEVATWMMVVGVVIFSAVTAKNPYRAKVSGASVCLCFRIMLAY